MGSFPRLRGKAGMGNTIVGHWCWREDCPQPVRSGAVYGHSDGPRDNAVQMGNEQARPAAAAGRGARRLQCGALSCNAPAVSFPGYDFTSHHLEVRPGIRMHYLDEGPRDGEVVVMLHGNPSWSYYWRHLVHGLRDRWRCIVPDHIGMGLSDKPDDRPIATPRYDYTLRSRVDDLSTLLEGIGITGPVTLAVHDWGGLIGFSWALGHPSRVKRLVILNTAAFPMPAAKTMPWQLSLGRDYFLGEVLIRGANAFAEGAARIGVARPMPRDVRRAYVAPYDSWRNRLAVIRFIQDIPLGSGDRAWPLLDAVGRALPSFASRPAFIGWGLKDFVFDHHFLDRFRADLPQAEVMAFEDAAHYVLEDKHEVLVPAIRGFLDRHPVI